MVKKSNLILLIISTTFSLIILELITPFFIINTELCEAYSKAELRELGNNYEYSNIPNLFFTPKPNSEKFNSLGMNDKEYNLQMDNATFKIMVIGDSVISVEEYLNNNRSNFFHEILEKKLNGLNEKIRYEVWNLGVRKYNTYQEYLYFENKFLRYKPDLIILAYLEYEDYNPPRLIYNPNYSPTKNCILSTIPNIFPLDEKTHEVFLNSNIYKGVNIITYNLLNKLNQKKYPNLYFKDKNSYEMMQKNRDALLQFKNLSVAKNIPLLVVIFPKLKDNYERDEWLVQTMENEFFFYIDLYPFFIKNESRIENLRSDIEDYTHPNEKAHFITAQVLYNYLLKNKLILS